MLWKADDKTYISTIPKNKMEKVLESLGLNNKEIKIYLSSLQLGTSLVQNIANHANINRTSTYDLLKSLEQKGFVSHVIKSRKKHYQATEPNKLNSLLKEKQEILKKALPELNSLSKNIGKIPSIEVYTEKQGLKTIFEDILNTAKSFSCIASKEQISKLFEFYLPHFVNQRKKSKIKVKLITSSEPLDKTAPYKIINKEIKTATWIYNGKIAMISLEKQKPIGIIIKENNFYETHKMIFDLLWSHL